MLSLMVFTLGWVQEEGEKDGVGERAEESSKVFDHPGFEIHSQWIYGEDTKFPKQFLIPVHDDTKYSTILSILRNTRRNPWGSDSLILLFLNVVCDFDKLDDSNEYILVENTTLKIVFNHLSLVVFYSGNGERCRYSRSQSGLQRAGQENGWGKYSPCQVLD